VWLSLDDRFAARFALLDDSRVLTAFALPDLVLVAAGSALAAVFIVARSRWAVATAFLVTGAMLYATLLVVALARAAPAGIEGPIAMVVGSFGSAIAAAMLVPSLRVEPSSQ
jgi:hypothetical protein